MGCKYHYNKSQCKRIKSSKWLCLQLCYVCDGSATFQIEMVSFRNDANTDSSGSSCDWFWSNCDTFFKFCIDEFSPLVLHYCRLSNNYVWNFTIFSFVFDFLCYRNYQYYDDIQRCSVFYGQTGEFGETQTVTFSHDMNGIQNPIVRQFDTWPVSYVI